MGKITILILLGLLAIFTEKGLSAPSEKDRANDDGYANDYEYAHDSDDDTDEDYEAEDDEEPYTGPPPVIYSRPIVVEVKPGATVMLPCNVTNLDPNIAVNWKKNTTFLFSDSIRMKDDKRLQRWDNNTLRIENVNVDDAGGYSCELSTTNLMRIVHTVHVFQKPNIYKVHPAPHHVVRKGSPLTLTCDVDGYPTPVVTWSRKGKRLPSGDDHMVAKSITFDSVTRHHNGTYECVARNSYGGPAKATVDVHVHYAPEVEIEKETVNTAEGYESELTCKVHAEPKARVSWFKEGKHLTYSERITETKEGSRHILRIGRTQLSDFGNYTCFANNSIGRTQQTVKLSGKPTKAQFVGESAKMQNGNYRSLSWTLESNSPITEYVLMYRKKDAPEWKRERPEVLNPEGIVYHVTAEIQNLESGTYEAKLLSKNAYGWSESSDIHQFNGIEYQKTEPQAKTVAMEDPSAEESSGSGVDPLRPSLLVAFLIFRMTYFFG